MCGGVCARGCSAESLVIVHNTEFSSEGAAGKQNYACVHVLHVHTWLEGFPVTDRGTGGLVFIAPLWLCLEFKEWEWGVGGAVFKCKRFTNSFVVHGGLL